MSERRRRIVITGALVVWLALPVPVLEATHFSWLGHGACPQTTCNTLGPTGFTALGEFAPYAWALLDEGATSGRPEERGVTLLTRDGREIARVTAAFRRQLDVEGAARLRDGRIVHLAETIHGQVRYRAVENAPFGVGAGYRLMPYRTVAVNPRRVPLGTVLFVPRLVGLPLPNGEVHDGFCFAHEIGRA